MDRGKDSLSCKGGSSFSPREVSEKAPNAVLNPDPGGIPMGLVVAFVGDGLAVLGQRLRRGASTLP